MGEASGEERQARETLKSLLEIKEKTEVLCEHIESRKEALEEEIEESFHEAIRNARECLEKIQENIEPKLEKVIEGKLSQINVQMESWKEDAKRIVRQEIDLKNDEMNQNLLDGLDARLDEKTTHFLKELKASVEGEVKKATESGLSEIRQEIKIKSDRQMISVGVAILIAIVAIALSLYKT